MKSTHTLLVMLLLAGAAGAQHLHFQPEKPVPGTKVKIVYEPAGTPLEGVDDLEAVAYLFEGEMPKAVEVPLRKDGAAFHGEVASTAEAKAMFLSLKAAGQDKSDNNGDKGYSVLFYGEGGGQPVQGAYAAKAQAIISFNWAVEINRDDDKALKKLENEFALYPASKGIEEYITLYARLAARTNNETALAELSKAAGALSAGKKPSEEELILAHNLYQTLGNEAQTAALAQRLEKKYPKGKFAMRKMTSAFYEEKDLEKRAALFAAYQAKFGGETGAQQTLEIFASTLAQGHARDKNWDQVKKYLALMSDKQRKAGLLNNMAWGMAGGSLDGEAYDLGLAGEFSFQSLQLMEEAMQNPLEGKPVYLTDKQWQKNLKGSYAIYANTYALILYKQGDAVGALNYQNIAAENNKYLDAELNERFAVYAETAGDGKVAERFLEKAIRSGAATPKMKEQYKRLFLAQNSKEEMFDKYLGALEEKAREKIKEKLREKMIDEAAPEFRLTNLKGDEVSLQDLKGKVVILDFWATWCGPCKASFPGMQRAVDHFKNDDKVAFLFVDTWERGVEDKQKNAADFIEQNKYTFEVLLDEKDEVVAKYSVEGIPTKFVVSPEGRIRFKSIGYNGNADELVEEIKLMVQVAAEGRGAKGMAGAKP